jgi:hypothetical protein
MPLTPSWLRQSLPSVILLPVDALDMLFGVAFLGISLPIALAFVGLFRVIRRALWRIE